MCSRLPTLKIGLPAETLTQAPTPCLGLAVPRHISSLPTAPRQSTCATSTTPTSQRISARSPGCIPGVDIHVRRFDAADEKAVADVVADALRRFGRLDVFFANAGITGPQATFQDVSEKDFMQTLRVNTLGFVSSFCLVL